MFAELWLQLVRGQASLVDPGPWGPRAQMKRSGRIMGRNCSAPHEEEKENTAGMSIRAGTAVQHTRRRRRARMVCFRHWWQVLLSC